MKEIYKEMREKSKGRERREDGEKREDEEVIKRKEM